MKIYIQKVLDNGVCISSVRTDDFSCDDMASMADFGEPEINSGGTFSTGVKAMATGTVSMAGGHDFSAHNEAFIIRVNGGSPLTITLTALCADLAAVVAHINTKLDAAGLEALTEAAESTNYVRLQSVSAGAGQSFILAAGTPDALALFGISAGSYTGSGMDDFHMPNNLVRVKSDSPFVGRFDSRDTDMVIAKLRGDVYASEITTRIETAMADLRAMTDDYSDETMITY